MEEIKPFTPREIVNQIVNAKPGIIWESFKPTALLLVFIYYATPISLREYSFQIWSPLALITTLALTVMHHYDFDQWEFFCRYFERSDRIYAEIEAKNKAYFEKVKREEEEEERIAQDHRLRMWEFSKTREDRLREEQEKEQEQKQGDGK